MPHLINRKNALYGEWNPSVSNVIFTHGQLDPWRAMGVQTDVSRTAPVIIIRGRLIEIKFD